MFLNLFWILKYTKKNIYFLNLVLFLRHSYLFSMQLRRNIILILYNIVSIIMRTF